MRRQKKERVVTGWVSVVLGLFLALLIWKMNPQADGSWWPAVSPVDEQAASPVGSQDQAPPQRAVSARSGSLTRPSPTVLTVERLAAAGKPETEWLEPSDTEPAELDSLEVYGSGISYEGQQASVMPGYSTWSAWRGASGGYGYGGGGGGGIGSPGQSAGAEEGSPVEETASRARVGGSSASGTPGSGAAAAVPGSAATESSAGGSSSGASAGATPNLSQLPPVVEKLLAAVGPFETVVQAAVPPAVSGSANGPAVDLPAGATASQGFEVPGDSPTFAALVVPEQPRLNPEPATLLLLGTGLVWTARRVRRSRDRAKAKPVV